MAETIIDKPDGVEQTARGGSLGDNLSPSTDLPESGDKPSADNVIPINGVTEKAAVTQEAKKPEQRKPVRDDKSAKAEKVDNPQKEPKAEKISKTPKAPKQDKSAGKEDAAPAPEPEQPPQPREAPRPNGQDQIIYLNLSELKPFKNHPFGIREDAEMKALVESVRDKGVNQPALVRLLADGGYEIIAGHRRQKASELAGYADMPCIVREMTDDEAVLAMTDDNLRQRSEILPSEKAQSLKMQFEAVKHQGGRFNGIASGDIGKRSIEIVGERNGITGKQVQRYIRLTSLMPELMQLADKGKLSFTPAVEMSFINKKNQQYIAVAIEGQDSSPTLAQAQRMRELDKDGKLNPDIIDGILCEEKKEVDKVIINSQELSQYFGKDKTPREMKDKIMELLAEWREKQPPELVKPVPAKEAEK